MSNTSRTALQAALTRTDLSKQARYDIIMGLKSDANAVRWVRALRAAGLV